MNSSERLSGLAKKTPEEILVKAGAIAEIEAETEVQEGKRRADPLSIRDESQYFAWSIERWIDRGADLKMVMNIISAGFVKVFAIKGYVLKLKAEKLF